MVTVVDGLEEILRRSTLEDKLQEATAWCAERGAVCVDDIRDFDLTEDFVSALKPLLEIPERKLRRNLDDLRGTRMKSCGSCYSFVQLLMRSGPPTISSSAGWRR